MRCSLVFFLLSLFNYASELKQYYFSTTLMSSPFELTVVTDSQENADKFYSIAVNETLRIEDLFSTWKPFSQVSEINRQAGINPVKVDKEVLDLIERGKFIGQLTDGAFDISWAGMDKVWVFDGSLTKVPNEDLIKNSVKKVNYKNILIDKENQTIFLKEKGMKLGLDGIIQGYVADSIKKILIQNNCSSGLINVSGDIALWGKQSDGNKWKVGVKNPLNKNKIIAWFDLEDTSLETSGTYEKFIEIDGVRYSHIINPKTGFPSTGISSITVFSPSTEMADALATGLLVMGKEVALDFVNQLKGVDCIIITDDGSVLYSKNLITKINYNNDK
ncbi:MAG: FAD:protein FMN transferase [Flavobacteriales bacterium]|nr:FAD:protein FMN transferase [Flavobacteriales bacterium]